MEINENFYYNESYFKTKKRTSLFLQDHYLFDKFEIVFDMLRTMLNHHLVFVFLHKTFRICKKSTCSDLSSNLSLIIRNYAKYRLYISYIQIIISDTLIKDNVIIGINGINTDNTFLSQFLQI